jgi:hypothetical protein
MPFPPFEEGRGVRKGLYTNSKSRRYLRWLVFGSSKYYLYAFVASILAALISSLI